MSGSGHRNILKKGLNFWNTYIEANQALSPDLREVDLRGKDLSHANFNRADFRGAKLSGSYLFRVNLSSSDCEGADFTDAVFFETNLANCNLKNAKNLNTCIHKGPSIIDHRTLRKSGNLSKSFLRGIGLSAWEIEQANLYDTNLSPKQIADTLNQINTLRSTQPIQVRPVFISYSHQDSKFVDKFDAALSADGISAWRDTRDAVAGPLEDQVADAMFNRVTVIVLSTASTISDWVETEVSMARAIEKSQNRNVLLPIQLDDSWKECRWPKQLLDQLKKYMIVDFKNWKNDTAFRISFNKLAEGIRRWYS